MSKNPFLNALAAALYILLITAVMTFGSKIAPKQDSFLAPTLVLSLFTLSAAVMAYIFCYEPLQLFLANKKKQAITLFLHTVVAFSVFTIIIMLIVFSGVLL